MPKAAALALILPLAAGALSASPPDPKPAEPSVASIASGYSKYRLITPQPVLVDPQLAVLCAPASPAMSQSSRAQHGPHADAAIKVYMNDLAADAFASHAGTFPVGAVIVKEKVHSRDAGATQENFGVGGMVKRAAGYDAKHGDWEYFYFNDPARVVSGAIASCTGCHASAKASDHVFGSWHPSAPPSP